MRLRRFHPDRSKTARLALAYSPACVFAFLVAGSGTPVLRHDWFTVAGRSEIFEFTLSTLAWQPDGIGTVRVYPADYLFAIVHTLLALVLGTHIGFFVYVALIGAMCLYGARTLAALEPNDPLASFGLALFALFNPWVYVKVVEGHLAMIAAYGALMALTAELWRPQPRWIVAAFLLAPMAQLQFFILGIASCACAAVFRRERAALVPLGCGLIFALPTIAGISVDGNTIRQIPYNLDWQTSQSIAPIEGAALTGFFTNYARGLSPLAFDAVWSLAALALIGLAVRRQRRSLVLLVVAVVAWAFSTGTKGPLAALYEGLVQHFPPIQLYRELYDLLALVAIAYVGIAAVATGRFTFLRRAAIVPGVVLAACWIGAPPSRWWVNRLELPRLSVDAPPNTRFALYPDIDPLRFGSRGSGTDPDAYARFNNVTTVNGSDIPFPAMVALQRYARTGDVSALRVLGVSRIYGRSWLTSDLGSASGVSAVPNPQTSGSIVNGSRSIAAEPELALLDHVAVTSTLPEIGSGQIFFGDVAGLSGPAIPVGWSHYSDVRGVPSSRKDLLASEGWVDVRGAFIAEPELGQPFGGALTTSSTAMLPVEDDAGGLLVFVRGTLLAQSARVLTGTTHGYAWIAIPRSAHAVRCEGECVVAARGTPPVLAAPAVPLQSEMPLHAPTPWLAWTELPVRHNTTVLKYLVGYDRAMLAFTPLGTLPHFRIEAAFNGWLVAGHDARLPVLIVDVLSALQFVLEILGFTLFAILGWKVARPEPTPAGPSS